MTQTTWVTARFRLEGFHKWLQAPTELDYLREKHRHMFHFEVSVETPTQSRSVEFISLGNWCQKVVSNQHPAFFGSFTADGCEDMARWMIHALRDRFPDEPIRVTVSEDGENGATVEDDGA